MIFLFYFMIWYFILWYDILGFIFFYDMIFLCFILHLSYFLDPFNILAYPLKDPGLMSPGMMTASFHLLYSLCHAQQYQRI